MTNSPSGPQTATRFFGYRWAYWLIAGLLWLNLLTLLLTNREGALLAPVYVIYSIPTDHYPDFAGFSVDGIFGFSFDDDTVSFAATMSFFAVAIFVAAFSTPESGQTRHLPAMRGLHLRAKLVVATSLSVCATSLIAAALDAFRVDLIPLFTRIGWLSTHPFSSHRVRQSDYTPTSGIIAMPNLISIAVIFLIVGGGVLLSMHFRTIGRDRYWQAERWTLLITCLSIVQIVISIVLMRGDHHAYANDTVYLGGCYSGWITGWALLTLAWTCRTLLLSMMQEYERASIESDQPVCFACGYDLRMLVADKCPECGVTVHPEVVKRLRSTTNTHAESRSTTR